jgi:competence protein ComEA
LFASSPPGGNPIKSLPPPSPIPIKVHVSGEVDNPRVYTLPLNSRIQDTIQAAGGFTDLADSMALNLAALLQDGSQVHVPIQNIEEYDPIKILKKY